MQPQKLCLKWNSHTNNLLSQLGEFQRREVLADVTISCEGHNVKAHKMVLSVCSPYFEAIFQENPCQHPIVIINGMSYENMSAILDFMYKGEVNVVHDGLQSFLHAAETLQVKGLAEVYENEKKSTNSSNMDVQPSNEQNYPQRTDTPPRRRQRNRKRSLSDSNRSEDEGSSRKHHREPSSPEVHDLSGDESYTGDTNSNGPPFNNTPRVPQNMYSRAHHSSSNLEDEDEEFEVDPSKLLEQNLTTDSVSMNNSSSDKQLRIEKIMGNATEIESSSLQEPESPPDIKPIIDYGDSNAGPSEGNMMLYNDQSQPGPSNMQDGSLIHDNSHAQDFEKMSADIPDVPAEILPFLMQRPELSVLRPKAAKPPALPSPQLVHYRCDMCLFETSVHQHYQNHMMEHTSSQRDYPRAICNRPYKSEYKLQVHMQSHEQSTNVPPNVCIYCEKRFKTPTLLNNHMKTHFPETVVCPICNKILASKASLKKHFSTMHSNENYQK